MPYIGQVVHYVEPEGSRCTPAIVYVVHSENAVGLLVAAHPDRGGGAGNDEPVSWYVRMSVARGGWIGQDLPESDRWHDAQH